MYTNELVERKREAQRALLAQAQASGKTYAEVVEEKARRWLEEGGFTLHFARPEPNKPARQPVAYR